MALHGWVRKDRWGRYLRTDLHFVAAPIDMVIEEFGGVDIWLDTYQDMQILYPEVQCTEDDVENYFGGFRSAREHPGGTKLDPERISAETPCGFYWCDTDIMSVNQLKGNLRKRNRRVAEYISGPGTLLDPDQCRARVHALAH